MHIEWQLRQFDIRCKYNFFSYIFHLKLMLVTVLYWGWISEYWYFFCWGKKSVQHSSLRKIIPFHLATFTQQINKYMNLMSSIFCTRSESPLPAAKEVVITNDIWWEKTPLCLCSSMPSLLHPLPNQLTRQTNSCSGTHHRCSGGEQIS